MKEIYFVRHGQTEWNAIRRMQGQWNSDLSELGRAQADINGKFLKQIGIDYLVASPLDRTRQTAEIITDHLQIEFGVDDRIKEWDCGDWSGEMWDDLQQKWPDEFSAWQLDQFHYRGPNAENYPDMVRRSTPFLNEVLATEFSRVAVVSHGMIGRAMIGTLLSMPPEEMLGFSQTNDTVIKLTTENDGFKAVHYVGGTGPNPGLPPRRY